MLTCDAMESVILLARCYHYSLNFMGHHLFYAGISPEAHAVAVKAYTSTLNVAKTLKGKHTSLGNLYWSLRENVH